MRTTKPISTISYNTKEFLLGVLDNEIKLHRITFYSVIEHEPEEDEKKKHFHVYIVPNVLINTGEYQDKFNEYFYNGMALEKPLRCLPFNSSKFYDWYKYSKHDFAYLTKKFQSRKYHYNDDNFINSDDEYFQELTKECEEITDKSLIITQLHIYAEQGMTYSQFVSDFNLNDNQIIPFRHIWNDITYNKTIRNDRTTHDE